MLDLSQITHETFEGIKGSRFKLHMKGGVIPCVLEEVSGKTGNFAPSQKRAAFSLMFQTNYQAYLPQNTYRLEHETLQEMDLFLVPVGMNPEGVRLQAVFT